MNAYWDGLRALREVNEVDGSDGDHAGDAFFAVLEMGLRPEEVANELVEAVGRWLAAFSPAPPLSLELHRSDVGPAELREAYRASDVIRFRVVALVRDVNLAHLTLPC